jgi:hypothetical protein
MYAFFRSNGRALFVTSGVLAWCALAWAALPFAAFAQTRTEPAAADLSASIESGFARLVFTFPEEIKADVQLSNNVLVIRFAKPMRVPVDRVQAQFKEFVQAVRADPDGSAVRIAFLHRMSVNSMEAGEKLFVDLLPSDWTGLPPGLPQEIVDELAKRAREAERKARTTQDHTRVWQPIRLRVADAPTFSRFAFTMGEPVPVAAVQDGQEFRITFNAPVKLEFGEAQATLPPGVISLSADYAEGVAVARLVLAPRATLRQFREQSAFVVDVTPPSAQAPQQIQGEAELPGPQEQAEAKPTPPAEPAPAAERTPPPLPAPVAQQSPPPAVQARQEPADAEVRATVTQATNGVRLSFPFSESVASAVFRRGDRIWIVFDTARAINVSELTADRTRSFSEVSVADGEHGKIVRLKLKGGWLTSAETEGNHWVIHFGDAVVAPTRPLMVRRLSEDNGAALSIPFDGALKGKIHRIDDPEIGDDIHVVTAMMPVRGVLRAQDFLEFRMLPSAHGVALLPLADDVQIALRNDLILVGRPKGLLLSTVQRAPNTKPERITASPLDATLWEGERNRRFRDREDDLITASASAAPEQRLNARFALATFYLAHGLAAEGKGVIEAIVREDSKTPTTAQFHLLRGLSELMIGRPAKALNDLSHTELADSHDAALLRTIAHVELSAWPEARESFRAGAMSLRFLPADLQRRILLSALRAAVEVRDFAEANRLMIELEATEVPEDMAAQYAVLAGRIAEGLGRLDRADSLYATAAKLENSPAAAEARYKQIELKFARGEYNRAIAIERLEGLSFFWRGDRTELEFNRLLARLYVEEARYRDAFRLLDAALLAQANASLTRTLQNEMSQVFEDLFLSGKADALPAIEALALYYDFAKLTPIGRRGDELIRRLSERLISVDLLDQAAELLQHQVEFRLTGAAKAQVAARLAIVHLMNRKPQRAVAILAATRLADLPQDLREQRVFLESRALMNANRFDQAMDMLVSIKGPEADRQRADILFQAKRWRQAGEAIEFMLGERWKDDEALDEIGRHDVLRAGLAYALAGETLGLTRLKEKFGPRLSGAAEKAAFDQITPNPAPRAIAATTRLLANIDSLSVFLKMYQARFPAVPSQAARADQLTAR